VLLEQNTRDEVTHKEKKLFPTVLEARKSKVKEPTSGEGLLAVT
jgi:hypothetical protein